MPAAAEIACLFRLLAHFEDLRIVRHRLDEIVDLQRAEPAAECQMLLRRQMLVAEENHEVGEQRLPDLGNCRVGQLPC